MKKTARRKPSASEVHSHLTIAVEGYDASVSVRVNRFAYDPQHAWRPLDDEPVYEFTNRLVVSGTLLAPKDMAGDRCVITLYGGDAPVHDLDAKLEDIAELDEYRAPRYRKYRGREVPVYRAPRGLGVLDKGRGETDWNTSLFVKPSFVDRWVTLLGSSRDLYISLHECKTGRSRWVRGIKLGTVNPDEE